MASESSCFHCGLPVPQTIDLWIEYEHEHHAVCCAGCQAVAQGIIDAGLGSYYHNRTALAEQAVLPPEDILAQLKLYDLPEMQTAFVEMLPENEKEAMLMLSGITCAACTWLIEQKLLRQNGVVKVELNYSTQRARVRWNDAQVHLSDILLLIQQTGYSAAPYDPQKVEAQAQQERKKMLIRIAIAGLASMQTMMFALPTYLYHDIEPEYLTILHWGAFLMVLPAMFYSAQPFFWGAWRDWSHRRVGMDTPVALALTLTFVAGLSALLSHAGQGMYFESIAMFVFFLLLGRFMEQSTRRKAGDAAERLVKLVPAFCHRVAHYPDEETVEAVVASLRVGDVVVVRAGEVVPVDGVVLRGESEVNESMLTGESTPIGKVLGDAVIAGTLNISNALMIQATHVGHQTRLAHIVKLLDRALSEKPRLAAMAERYASHFIWGLVLMAVPTFLGWWWFADANRALWITVSLLVITCPCALSLATPAALAASMGRLAERGILVARGHALEGLAEISDAVFDKTGTLTQGQLSVVHWERYSDSLSDEDVLAVAQLLECQSSHPVATAILNLENQLPCPHLAIAQRLNKVGYGVSAQLTLRGETQTWAIGKPEFVAEISGRLPEAILALAAQGSVVALGNQLGFQAAFLLRDAVKSHAEMVVQQLAKQGISLHILSGDNQAAVQQLATQLAIPHYRAAATPEDKLHYVQHLQQQGKRVLMLGDGINDAPVLAVAHVSVAVAGSADVARDGADVILLQDDFNALPEMLQQAQRTQRIIRQNLVWASAYNLVVVPLAVCGWVTPWIAALGMSASSLLVVWNALRLRK